MGGALGFPITGTWRGLWLSSPWTAQVGPQKVQVGEAPADAWKPSESLASRDAARSELVLRSGRSGA